MGLLDAAMNQNINSINSVSIDGRGNRTTTTVYSNVKCRWSPRIGRVIGQSGENEEVSHEAFIPSEYSISYDYQITKDSTTYRIVRIEDRVDLTGRTDHRKLYLV